MTMTQQFLLELYYDYGSGWISLWTKQNKITYWFPINDFDVIASAAQRLSAEGKDVYFGVGLAAQSKPQGLSDSR